MLDVKEYVKSMLYSCYTYVRLAKKAVNFHLLLPIIIEFFACLRYISHIMVDYIRKVMPDGSVQRVPLVATVAVAADYSPEAVKKLCYESLVDMVAGAKGDIKSIAAINSLLLFVVAISPPYSSFVVLL